MKRFLLFPDPKKIHCVDDLDLTIATHLNNEEMAARCESIATAYPGTTSSDVFSIGGICYRETPFDNGHVYHRFCQWVVRIGESTWERRNGFLPVFFSSTPLGGCRYTKESA